jgi:two-component system sensor histidine kinase UhpB
MNLKLHVLIRMTLMGLLCWLGVSIYLVAQSGRGAARDIGVMANQLQPIVSADVMRRWTSLDSDARYPDLGGAAARFPVPMCLRYNALDGSHSDWGCNQSLSNNNVPSWIVRVLNALGPGHISLQRQITAYGLPVGTLQVESDDATFLQRQWRSVRELLGLTAVTLLMLDFLAVWSIGRALRPTARIVAAIEQLSDGAYEVQLPLFRPREFTLIASGFNQLSQRLARLNATRAELTARLIRLQEDERRELAHELHEEFGQSVTALGAVSASLRHSVSAGEILTEADVTPLETAVEQMLSALRGMLQRVSLPPLEQQGLRSAVSDLVAACQVKLHGNLRVVLDVDPGIDRVPNDDLTLCVYRVVQECLNNIAGHAPNSQTACVSIRHDPQGLHVCVSNDLASTTVNRAAAGTGMGLKLLGERVRSLGGAFSVEVSAAQYVVQAHLPGSVR